MIRAAIVLLAFWASPACAHGTIAGGGSFYGGFAHPFVALDQFLLIFALGLTLGHARQADLQRAAIGLMAAALVGLWLASRGILLPATEPTLLAGSAVLGVGLAAAVRLPGAVALIAAITVGFVTGNGTDVPMAAGSAVPAYDTALMWAGTLAALFLIAMNAAVLSAAMTRPVLALVRRILGSWLAAISLMVLALQASA